MNSGADGLSMDGAARMLGSVFEVANEAEIIARARKSPMAIFLEIRMVTDVA